MASVTIPGGSSLNTTGLSAATQTVLGNAIQTLVTNNSVAGGSTTPVVVTTVTPPAATVTTTPTVAGGSSTPVQTATVSIPVTNVAANSVSVVSVDLTQILSSSGLSTVAGANTAVAVDLSRTTGAGTQIVTLAGTTPVAVTTGSAPTVLALGDGRATVSAGAGDATLIGGAGDGFFTFNDVTDITANATSSELTSKDGIVTSVAGTIASRGQVVTGVGNSTVNAWTGNNTIVAGGTIQAALGKGANVLNATATTRANIFLGAGTATVFAGTNSTISGGTGSETIVGASGSVIFAGTGAKNLISAGAGNSTIVGSSANSTLIAGSGTNLIGGGTGNETVIGGTGRATVFGGAGNDVFAFFRTQGGGTTTIGDFTSGQDKLSIQGYGLTTAQLLATATVSAGSTTLTLADGTKIILNGVASLKASDFG